MSDASFDLPKDQQDRKGTDLQRLTEDGAQTLDYLVRHRVVSERSAVLRGFHQVAARNPAAVIERWWQVLADAAATLQLRPAVLDCSIDQVIRLVRDGADVAMMMPAGENRSSCWVVLKSARAKTFSWWDSHAGDTVSIKSERKLQSRLAELAQDERIRCVAFDWREIALNVAVDYRKPMRPLSRVTQLLRAEWHDIYLVIIFAFVVGLLTLASPIAVESLVNTVAFGRFLQPILVLSLVLLTFLGFSAAIRALQTFIVEIIQQRLFARVAADFAHRIPRISMEKTEEDYLPELANRFFDVVTVQKVSAFLLLDGISLTLNVAIGMAVLAFYHPFLLGFDAFLLLAIAFIIFVLGRGAVKTAVKESKSKYYMAAWLEDVSRCQTTFTSAAGKSLAVSRTDRLVHDYLVNRKKHFRVLFRQIIFSLGLQAIASTVLLGLGGYLVVLGELTLGQLVAAELIVTMIVGAFAKMGKHLESFYDLCASVDKLGAVFDLPLSAPGTILQSSDEVLPELSFEAVSYARGSHAAFSPVSAKVPGGSTLAVTGSSGSGKSTLLDLIYGNRRPSTGQIRVHGFQPCDLQSDDFWSHVELVRDGEVFAGSIEENLHLQRNDVLGEEVEHALEVVGLLPVIHAMPEGLRTHLASHGAPLSSNQVRLLLLARALAARPNLLLIDGVLESLADDDAERILDYLMRKDRDFTLVIATGRTWIAGRCDQVLDLDTGKLLRDASSIGVRRDEGFA